MPPGSTRVAVAAYSSEVGKSARIEISMRIDFFFNNYAGYQVPYAVPFVFELDECVSPWKVSTICPDHIIDGRPAVAEPAAAAG